MSRHRESAGRPRDARAPRGLPGVLLAAVCLTTSLAGCSMDTTAFGESLRSNWEVSDTAPAGSAEAAPGTAVEDAAVPASSLPAVLEIPRIGVRKEVLELGIDYDGTMEVPEDGDDVGWYSPDARPDSAFPTVFAGHVDTVAGPAVFARLPELEPGDDVTVTDAGGQVHTYRVDRVEDHPVDAYPTVDVFGPAPEDEIRLITCTGVFDYVQRQYDQNRVVYASLSG